MVVGVVTEVARESALNELLYADDLVLMSETIQGLRDKFLKYKEAYESKGLKVNLGKTRIIVSSGITQDGLSKCTVDPCRVNFIYIIIIYIIYINFNFINVCH